MEVPGGGDRARTDDPLLAKQVLSQLSYTPDGCAAAIARQAKPKVWPKAATAADPACGVCFANACRRGASSSEAPVVGQGGFEPPTSRLSSARSNQLSY